MNQAPLRTIAHQTLCLSSSPLLRHQRGGRFERIGNVACTKSGSPGPSFNFVAALLPPLPTLDEILPKAESVFGTDRASYGILVDGGQSEPLESELKERGYQVFEDEPAFVRPDLRDVSIPDTPLNIVPVSTKEEFHTYCRLVTDIFQAPPELAEELMPASCLNEPDLQLFLGFFQEKPVSAVCSLKTGNVAHIAGTATLEPFRGRGWGAALVLAALAHARDQGCVAAALRSGPLSIPLYQRLGFIYVCQHRTYSLPQAPPR